jgi:hypothetical protein
MNLASSPKPFCSTKVEKQNLLADGRAGAKAREATLDNPTHLAIVLPVLDNIIHLSQIAILVLQRSRWSGFSCSARKYEVAVSLYLNK